MTINELRKDIPHNGMSAWGSIVWKFFTWHIWYASCWKDNVWEVHWKLHRCLLVSLLYSKLTQPCPHVGQTSREVNGRGICRYRVGDRPTANAISLSSDGNTARLCCLISTCRGPPASKFHLTTSSWVPSLSFLWPGCRHRLGLWGGEAMQFLASHQMSTLCHFWLYHPSALDRNLWFSDWLSTLAVSGNIDGCNGGEGGGFPWHPNLQCPGESIAGPINLIICRSAISKKVWSELYDFPTGWRQTQEPYSACVIIACKSCLRHVPCTCSLRPHVITWPYFLIIAFDNGKLFDILSTICRDSKDGLTLKQEGECPEVVHGKVRLTFIHSNRTWNSLIVGMLTLRQK